MISLVNVRVSGGVGVRLPLLCVPRLRTFREKIAPAMLRTFLFLMIALRSGDVFGRIGALVACTTGEEVVSKVIGSVSSRVGVCFGVLFGDSSLLPAGVNQNRFLFAGPPEFAKKLVESDADRGLFSRVPFPTSSNRIGVFGVGLAASAVFGLCTRFSPSKLGEGVDRAAGLLIDVMLPVNE